MSDEQSNKKVDRYVDPEDIIARKEFKPTVARPLPTFRCTVIKSDGERCNSNSEMGYTEENAVCYNHAKKLPAASKDRREKLIQAARMKMSDNLDLAVETLLVLQQPGSADGVRLKAATELMDRVGLRAGYELEVTGEIKVDTAEHVKKNFQRLRDNMFGDDEEDEIVDAEVVENDPDPDSGSDGV